MERNSNICTIVIYNVNLGCYAFFNTASFIHNKSYWHLKIIQLNNDTNIDNDSIFNEL